MIAKQYGVESIEKVNGMFPTLCLTAALAAWSVHAQSSSCPGYTATDITTTDSGLTARLNLAGPPCNSFGKDLHNLTLLVEYQTGISAEI